MILSFRETQAEVADQLPVGGDIEDRSDRSRIKDRHPSHADPLSPGRQPQSMDRGDRRILDHLRHRVPAETMSLGGFVIGTATGLPAGQFTVYKKSRPDCAIPDPAENLILFSHLETQGACSNLPR